MVFVFVLPIFCFLAFKGNFNVDCDSFIERLIPTISSMKRLTYYCCIFLISIFNRNISSFAHEQEHTLKN